MALSFLEFKFAEVSKVCVTLEEKAPMVLLTHKQFEIPTDEQSMPNIHHGRSVVWTFWLA